MIARIALYSAGGYARETLPFLQAQLATFDALQYELSFIDDADTHASIHGLPVRTYEQFMQLPASSRQVCVAIANSHVREKLENRLLDSGVSLLTVHAANLIRGNNVEIGEGSILSAFVTLTGDCQIGRSFHANIYSYVAHDCVIGDFVTFAPRVSCNGNVIIEDHAYIGTGAVLRQGTPNRPLRIGRGAVVGMGAVVTKDVPPGVTVVGNPARPLVK